MKAISIVHWPGKEVPACAEHEGKLKELGRFMGFAVSSTPNVDEDLACTNCENEARKREVEP
jgi:hypothetical protein